MEVTRVHGIKHAKLERQGHQPDEWKPPRSRFGLYVGLGALALIVALAVGYRLWLRSERGALEAALERLRQEGEPTTAADLARPPVPAADNAAFDLRSAATLIDPAAAEWKDFG